MSRSTNVTATRSETIRQMIDEQYATLEEYCQTQTLVGNMLVTNTTTNQQRPPGHNSRNPHDTRQDLSRALQQLRTLLCQLQTNSHQWHQLLLADHDTPDQLEPELYAALLQHVERYVRILKTVYQPYHANGIPVTTTTTHNRNESNTVALASLRASGVRVQELLSTRSDS